MCILIFFIFLLLSFTSCQEASDLYQNCSFVTPPDGGPIPVFSISQNESFLVMELDPSTDAKCLDGTNFKFNYSLGSGEGKNKFIIDFLGGGFCGIADGDDYLYSCYSRSQMNLGSSKFLGPNGSELLIDFPLGYFSNIKAYNPKFYNWNKLGINYCDGNNHQGYVRDPYIVNDTEIWFRGYNNTMGVLEWAKKHLGLFEAEEIVIAGESAGGHSVYFWSTYFQDYFPKNIKLTAIAEAGFFLDTYNTYQKCNLFGYFMKQQAYYSKSNETDLFRNCSYKNSTEDWKCLIPEYIAKDINIPVFVINSQNDYESLRSQMGIVCITNGSETCSDEDKEIIRGYRMEFLRLMLEIKKLKKTWGFWLRSCIEHIYYNWGWYSTELKVLNAESNMEGGLMETMHRWYDELDGKTTESHSFIDMEEWEGHCSVG